MTDDKKKGFGGLRKARSGGPDASLKKIEQVVSKADDSSDFKKTKMLVPMTKTTHERLKRLSDILSERSYGKVSMTSLASKRLEESLRQLEKELTS